MKNLLYDELMNEVINILEKEQNLVFATSANDIVTARTMCFINNGTTVVFSTGEDSEKIRQVRKNPNVALVIGALTIEGTAELGGFPHKNADFIEKNNLKYPWMASAFPFDPDNPSGELVICRPLKIKLYKFIDSEPHWDILYITENKAVRI